MTADLPLDWTLQGKLLGFADRLDHRPDDEIFRTSAACPRPLMEMSTLGR
jgi:hypothetical protein